MKGFGPLSRLFAKCNGRVRWRWLAVMTGLFLQGHVTGQPGAAEPVTLPGPASGYEAIAERVARRIDTTEWMGGKVSMAVRHATLPIVVVNREAERPVPIAELTQIVTAAAALDILGPEFRFVTELLAVAPDEKEGTATAIVVRGTGDPSISTRYAKGRRAVWRPIDEWVKLLRRRGIKKVDGPVIGDDFAFDEETIPPGWPPDLLGDAAYPSVSALNFNHNAVELDWTAGKEQGAGATFALFPELDKYVFISNQVRVVERGAVPGNWLWRRNYRRNPDGNLIAATGMLHPRQKVVDRAAIDDPARFFAEAMRARMIKGRIAVEGPAASRRAMPNGRIPGNPVSMGIRFSPPLMEMLGTMMREDEALEGEVIFKTLGRNSGIEEAPGNFTQGSRAVARFLDKLHLPGPAGQITDGSGRSDLNRHSVGAIVGLMHHAFAVETWGPQFRELFPAVGSEGTLTGRLQPAQGRGRKTPRIRAKPGSAAGCEAMAGFAESRSGDLLLFAVVVEGSGLPPEIVRDRLDSLLIELTQ